MSIEDFTLLVKIWHHEYSAIIDSAKIFELRLDSVINAQSQVKYQLDNYPGYCLLPFQSIIIKYDDYPMVLMISDPESDLIGYFVSRNIWIFMPWKNFIHEFKLDDSYTESIEYSEMINYIPSNSFRFIAGLTVPDGYKREIHFKYHCASIMTIDSIIRDIRGRSDMNIIYSMFNEASSAFIEWIYGNLLLLNQPERRIVQVDDILKYQYPEENFLYPSTYILMKPDEIRKIAGLSKAFNGTAKTPHERRRHFRTLESNYFKNKRGETIVIPATWIGQETQFQKGDKIYKVLLDK
jgi:hypothetical protein